MDPAEEFGQLRLGFVDPVQWRYEVIRPLVLFGDRSATQRAHETHTHPDTVRTLRRRFRQQGMRGLLPSGGRTGRQPRALRVPEAVRQEVDRLKALYPGFHYRELARILSIKFKTHINDKTAKRLWTRSAVAPQGQLPLWNYHTQPERQQARLQVITLYAQGWEKRSISRFLQVSRPTIDAWITRFETAHFAGLLDRSRAPKAPARKVWLPLMLQVYHLQKRQPDAGGFRLWSLLAPPEISVRTVERIMALNRPIYDDIPPGRKPGPQPPPPPQPYKAEAPHQYWFIDGRKMDFALDGGKWWSLIVLDGYSRTLLAGAVAPTEASGVALMVLYTACLRYGIPQALISDSGGAFTSNEFAAVCTRLQIAHKPIESTKGESYSLNLWRFVEGRSGQNM